MATQAHLRLYVHRLVRRGHRLLELHRVGAPYVRRWRTSDCAGVLCYQHDAHCYSYSGEDFQLVGHYLPGQDQPEGADDFRAGLHWYVPYWWLEWRGPGGGAL